MRLGMYGRERGYDAWPTPRYTPGFTVRPTPMETLVAPVPAGSLTGGMMRSRGIRIGLQLTALVLVVWLLVFPQLRGSSHSLRLLWDLDTGWVPLALLAEL